ncbi:uncharacterized protein METZ01_LOCUS261643 [marine metagenome]|uniref:Uncharacterized protein n=1 Tax=marine metagenome TaxID=408172 RepID=A0A382JAV3_9ZZZZ
MTAILFGLVRVGIQYDYCVQVGMVMVPVMYM